MAKSGTGYFDRKGHFFKTPRDATVSDLAALLGQIGEGESLAPGIAHMLLERRADIEALFAEHDAMVEEAARKVATLDEKVSKLPQR
jgi:phage shock protein A